MMHGWGVWWGERETSPCREIGRYGGKGGLVIQGMMILGIDENSTAVEHEASE